MTLQKLTSDNVLYVPLTPLALDRAEIFALEQVHPERRKRVYLKTLAVYSVADWINYEIEGQFIARIPGGDFYDPLLRATLDIGDVEIVGLGKVECCSILDEATNFALAPETLTDRIAYIVVRIPEDLIEVELLGFLPSVDIQDDEFLIHISDLKPMAEFPQYLAFFSLNNRVIHTVELYLSDRGITTDRYALSGNSLVLPGIGTIECCTVILDKDQEVSIPKLEWNDRVAFVIVGLENEDSEQGEILGFFSAFLPGAFIPDAIPLDDRKPIDDLVPYLQAIQSIERVFAEHAEERVFQEMAQMLPGYSLDSIAPCLQEIADDDTYFQALDLERWLSEIMGESTDRMRQLVLRNLERQGQPTNLTDEEIDRSFSDLVMRFIDRFFRLRAEMMKKTIDQDDK